MMRHQARQGTPSGPQAVQPSLEDRYVALEGVVHMTGIHALARLPLDVRRTDVANGHLGAVFISGYEGSPLAGYDLELGRHSELLEAHDIVFRPGLNEELAATAVQGTQLASTMEDKRVEGVTGFWYGKSPGFDRASDAIRHANLSGAHRAGGAVALVGDDPIAKSSSVPGASEMLLADLGIPTLYPTNPQEVLDFGLHAVAMSRASGLWTALKIVTNVADGSGTVDVSARRLRFHVPDLTFDSEPFEHEVTAHLAGPTLLELERSRNGPRLEIARRYAQANQVNTISGARDGATLGIVAAGKTWADLRQALDELGLDDEHLTRHGVRLLKLGMIYPLVPDEVADFVDGLEEIVVVEDKRPFIETALRDVLYGQPHHPVVVGKKGPDGATVFPDQGELAPDLIATALADRLLARGDFPSVSSWRQARRPAPKRTLLPLAVRTPYFCSGCPHNSSMKTPEGSLVGGGIGCHGLGLVMQPEIVGEMTGLTQMGGEGSQWIGMSPFVTRDHLLQNLGDGTFHHSGSLAVRASIAAGANITYKLLYNSAVAMTGGQQAVGQMSVPEIVRTMLAEGVKRIVVTTDDPKQYRRVRLPRGVKVLHRDHLIEAQEELAKIEGVTMLIHDQECATELRRKRKRGLVPEPAQRVVINERVCEGCGDCGVQSNCLSVQPTSTEFGRKTKIDQSSCNKDYSCLKGDCPSFLTVTPGRGKGPRSPEATLESDDLPPATVPDLDQLGHHTIRILGIGGSGVVTLSQILSVAATRAGLHVSSLDQTGLAQKGGAVVSDIKVSASPMEGANKAATGEADLYLGADLLVAADPAQLAVAAPSRTLAVVSTGQVATGRMVSDVSQSFPDTGVLSQRIRAVTRSEESLFFDARQLSSILFGEDQFANLLLIGAAYQAGSVPLPARAIEDAVGLNGVKVEQNIQAFRRGRQMVADTDAFEATVRRLGGTVSAPRTLSPRAQELVDMVGAEEGSALYELLRIRVPDLIAYQNVAYARTYAQYVRQVRVAEAEAIPGSSDVSESVARHLYKLMAYKDEYEVARLSLDPQVEADVVAQFGEGAKIAYRLHPPILRALGMRQKISLGRWFKPVFGVLRAMRRVRGTWFDPFGMAKVRRVERQLIAEYRRTMDVAVGALGPQTAELVLKIADLPDTVRGYEHIKLQNVEVYRTETATLLAELGSSDDPAASPAHGAKLGSS